VNFYIFIVDITIIDNDSGASVYYLTILSTENVKCVIVEIWFGGVVLKFVSPRTKCNIKRNIIWAKNT
jgi:hypothetical protein